MTNRPIRFKLTALLLVPLVSLVALWGYAGTLTLGDGLNLVQINTLYEKVAAPSEKVVIALQQERRLSVAGLANGSGREQLTHQRAATDQMNRQFQSLSNAEDARAATSPKLRALIDGLSSELARLKNIRRWIDNRQMTRLDAINAYSRIVDSAFAFYNAMILVPDISVLQQAQGLTAFGKAREMITREDALIAGVTAARRITPAERRALADMAAARRYQFEDGLAKLDDRLREPYERIIRSSAYARFTALEERFTGPPRGLQIRGAGEWQRLSERLTDSFNELQVIQSKRLVEQTMPIAIGILVEIAVAGVLGLIAVIVSIILSLRFGRRLARELRELRDTATELATDRLPRLVERLRGGESVDVAAWAAEAQRDERAKGRSTLEVKDVAHAFDVVRQTAVEAAVGQASLREGAGQVFRNLARRSQTLLHRQLSLLDAMERRSTDAQSLEDLFLLDHLTTRMRRHAENLIILSGAVPGRGWRRPVPMVDVIRGAVSEVEDYSRVTVFPVPHVALAGEAVADILHLLAELVENATGFSPPSTQVQIRSEVVANGFALEIEDRGLGLAKKEFAALNRRLAAAPEFDLADSDRLGLFVVGRLAARHGVRVVLRGSPFGGTTAIVLIPGALIAGEPDPEPRAIETSDASDQTSDVPDQMADAGDQAAIAEAEAETPPAVEEEPDHAEEAEPVLGAPLTAGTHAGLPRRVRRSSLARVQARSEPVRAETVRGETVPVDKQQGDDREGPTGDLYTAFREGWQRGQDHRPDDGHEHDGRAVPVPGSGDGLDHELGAELDQEPDQGSTP